MMEEYSIDLTQAVFGDMFITKNHNVVLYWYSYGRVVSGWKAGVGIAPSSTQGNLYSMEYAMLGNDGFVYSYNANGKDGDKYRSDDIIIAVHRESWEAKPPKFIPWEYIPRPMPRNVMGDILQAANVGDPFVTTSGLVVLMASREEEITGAVKYTFVTSKGDKFNTDYQGNTIKYEGNIICAYRDSLWFCPPMYRLTQSVQYQSKPYMVDGYINLDNLTESVFV